MKICLVCQATSFFQKSKGVTGLTLYGLVCMRYFKCPIIFLEVTTHARSEYSLLVDSELTCSFKSVKGYIPGREAKDSIIISSCKNVTKVSQLRTRVRNDHTSRKPTSKLCLKVQLIGSRAVKSYL